jgi:hypothetical protein
MRQKLTVESTFQLHAYRLAVGFAVAFSLLHLLSLPVAISYDGFIYIDMADVLGSNRFPHDWNIARTPLFPLCLKFAFWLLGRQPLAVIAVSTSLGLGGTLLLGGAMRKIMGELAGAAVVAVLSLFPLFVIFQHFALTEVGTAFFLIALTVLLLWQPTLRRHIWVQAIGLMAVCSAGYYWRQAIMSLAPAVALFHVIGSRARFMAGEDQAKAPINRWRRALPMAAQIGMIAILPFLLAQPWSPYVDEPHMRDVMLRQGILRQALIPADHPYVGTHSEAYRKAIQDSVYRGGFYSGLRADLLGLISQQVYSKPIGKPVISFYFDLIRENPGRYFSAVGRTLVLYSGVKALQNENLVSQEMILSPSWHDSKIGAGPPNLTQIREDFQQKTKPCLIQGVLWALAPVYGYLLIAANMLTVLGLLPLIILCAVPLLYMVNCAVVLASIDRYAFPAYPIVIANLVAVPLLVERAIRTRFQRGKLKSA